MNQLSERLISDIEPFMVENGFVLNKKKFSKKNKVFENREDYISLNFTKGNNTKVIYLNAMCGIYFPEVRKIEAKIHKDFINNYPIIAGSLSHFSEKNAFLNIPISDESSINSVEEELINEIRNGAFKLFNTFQGVSSILEGIRSKHPFLYEYYNYYDERKFITISCMVYLAEGLESTLNWLERNIIDDKRRNELMTNFNSLNLSHAPPR